MRNILLPDLPKLGSLQTPLRDLCLGNRIASLINCITELLGITYKESPDQPMNEKGEGRVGVGATCLRPRRGGGWGDEMNISSG